LLSLSHDLLSLYYSLFLQSQRSLMLYYGLFLQSQRLLTKPPNERAIVLSSSF
jgi:hypothetical protein